MKRSVGKCPQLERLINASAFNENSADGYGSNVTYIGGIQEYASAAPPNEAGQFGFCGPTENNGWWNPRN